MESNELSEIKKLVGKEFSCPLCDDDLDIRLDKHNKPYCVCDSCGVQLFIRKDRGVKELQRIVKWGILA